MSKPMVVVFHPDPEVREKLQKIALSIGARVRAVDDGGALPAEARRFGPDVILLPSAMASPPAALVDLVREDLPQVRIVLLDDGTSAPDLPVERGGRIRVGPEVDVTGAIGTLRAAASGRSSSGAVLVVEDQPVNLEMVADVLHSRGYRVLRAMSGEEAIELAAHGGPDMVLMDIYLPGMNGIDAVRRLKALPSTSTIPIVMLSANGSDSTVTDALESGAIDFIIKPFSPRKLLDKISLVLDKRELLAHA